MCNTAKLLQNFETVALVNQTQQDVEEFPGGRADAFTQLVLKLQTAQ